MAKKIEVKFQPEGKVVQASRGAKLHKVIQQAGIMLDLPCGGNGSCGKCRVKFLSTPPESTMSEKFLLSREELQQGYRLACQTRVREPMTIEIPRETVRQGEVRILDKTTFDPMTRTPAEPLVRKQYIELSPPSLEDDRPDTERLLDAIGAVEIPLQVLQNLPGRLRENGWKGTAVIVDNTLVDFEEGDTTTSVYGVAFDIGTTTLVGSLVDMATGERIAKQSAMNPQTRFGDDVISRIQVVREDENGLEELHHYLMDDLDKLIVNLCEQKGISPRQVYAVCLSGNTTMLHCAARISPAALGELPFVPVLRACHLFPASSLGLHIHPLGQVLTASVIGGFVGGDTVAGLMMARLGEEGGNSVLFDIGTNGELVVNRKGKLVATSCAAGPGLEGATLTHGMRATTGAIERIDFDGTDIVLSVIGNCEPSGYCGSALIDIIAVLLRQGILMPEGLLLAGEQLPEGIPPALRERVRVHDGEPVFVIAPETESALDGPVLLTQADIRQVQLALAAARAAFSILLRKLEMTPEDLDHVYVAGAFGNYLQIENARQIGLLSNKVPSDKYIFIGNASLAGAELLLLSKAARKSADILARDTQHIELSTDPMFQMEYVEAMFFPREGLPVG